MKKVLVTCFEPFGGGEVNASLEAVRALAAPDGTELFKVTLPVEWKTSAEKLFAAWDAFSPDAVLMTGLAAGSDRIRVERVAVNICGAIKDNRGLYPSGSTTEACEAPVREGAPTAYFPTCDHAAILAAMRKENVPAAQSFSAGTYICNFVFYSAMDRIAREKSAVRAEFIHLPSLTGEGRSPSLPLDVSVKALAAAVAVI